jgi:hypothetical protein
MTLVVTQSRATAIASQANGGNCAQPAGNGTGAGTG